MGKIKAGSNVTSGPIMVNNSLDKPYFLMNFDGITVPSSVSMEV